MKAYLKIPKSPWVWVVLFISIVIAGAVPSLIMIERQARKDAVAQLQTVLGAAKYGVDLWAHDYLEDTENIASSPVLIRLTKELLALPRDRESILSSSALMEVREFIGPKLKGHGDIGFFVIAPDFINVASLRDSNVAITNLIAQENRDILEKVFQGSVRIIPPILSDVPLPETSDRLVGGVPTMFSASAIRDENNKVIAVFTKRINMGGDFNNIAKAGRTWKTVETYFFDKDGKLLTESRFCEQLQNIGLLNGQESALAIEIRDPGGNMLKGFIPKLTRSEQPLTLMAQQAIGNKSEGVNYEGYRDYRGVPVLGAWCWNEELEFGMATEIDVEEALKSYYVTRWITIGLLSLTVSLSFAFLTIMFLIRKRSEEKLRYLALGIESAGEAMVMTDTDGNIQYVNSSFTKLTGYTTEEALGQNPRILKSNRCPPEFYEDMWQTIKSGKTFSSEMTNKRKDGSTYELDLSIAPVINKQGNIERYVAVQCDTTERKHIEKALHEKEVAEQANRAKEEFLASMSHELRSPLTSVIGFSERIPEKLKRGQTDKVVKFAKDIKISANHLLVLINDILDYAKIKAGKIELHKEKFSISEIVDQLRSQFDFFVEQKELQLVIEIQKNLKPVIADRVRLTQIVMNLFSNAVKFTPRGGVVKIIATTNGELILRVEDTGCGIAEEDLEAIFDRFKQVGHSSGEQQGTGLGLAITKRLVELHGGRIKVESKVRKGTSFIVTLPVNNKFAEVKNNEQGTTSGS